jgi:phosphatidate cytidylyltransferase
MDILPTPRRFRRSAARGRKAEAEPVIDLTDDTDDPDDTELTVEVTAPVEQPPPAPVAATPPATATGTTVTAAPATPATPATRAAARAARTGGRAGRNLPAAVLVGAVLGGLVIASLFIRKEAFVVLATLAIVVAVWELTEALAMRHIAVPLVPVAVGSVGMVVAAFAAGGQALAVCFALTCLGVLVWRVAEGHAAGDAVRDVAGGLLVAAYVPLLGGFTMLLLSPTDGPWRELTFVLLVVGSDTGGYIAGVLRGRHPMAPSVSPKKSWEGFAGSVLACVAIGVVTVMLCLDGSWWAGALTGVAAVAAATIGDLGESLIKRDLGIKDMSSLLPGHGGALDRIDSLLFAAPVVWVMLNALVKVS